MRTFRSPLAPRRTRAAVATAPRPIRHATGSLTTAGNLCFLVGSVLFLSEASQAAGVWLFIVGSAAFLVAGAVRGGD